MIKHVDLKWDSINLGITFDASGVEPEIVEGEFSPIEQSILISIRGSDKARKLINGDPSMRDWYIQELIEDLENIHKHVVVGSIETNFEIIPASSTGKLDVSMKLKTPEGQTKAVYFEDVLG